MYFTHKRNKLEPFAGLNIFHILLEKENIHLNNTRFQLFGGKAASLCCSIKQASFLLFYSVFPEKFSFFEKQWYILLIVVSLHTENIVNSTQPHAFILKIVVG